MPAFKKVLIFIAVTTMFQALCQMLLTALGLFQYFCIIDFLRDVPLLIYVKILYFHNPDFCGIRINIGESIESLPDQAFVLLTREPFTATRTFIINSISLGLSILWIIACGGLMRTGVNNRQLQCWSWIIITAAVSGVDIVATVTYASDSFHTKSLLEMMQFIGGTTSGTGNSDLNTVMTAWLMVMIYSRVVIVFFLNIIFIIYMIINSRNKYEVKSTGVQIEAPTDTVSTTESVKDGEEVSSEAPVHTIPRPGLRQSFRYLKSQFMGESSRSIPALPERYRPRGTANELQGQLPWAYVPSSTHHSMRDQLPPDEDLPPVPLPDYAVISFVDSVGRVILALIQLTNLMPAPINSSSPIRTSGIQKTMRSFP